jgi:hypothetical protein
VVWEYKIETISLDLEDTLKGSVVGALNEWGSEGWELVAFVPNAWGKDQTWPALIFKRPSSN